MESSGFPLRTQSEADLEAARWGLLAWEDPRTRSRFAPFWVDDKMVQAVAVQLRESAPAVAVLARETGISVTGLRLRNGNLRWDEIVEWSEDDACARIEDSKTGPCSLWIGPESEMWRSDEGRG